MMGCSFFTPKFFYTNFFPKNVILNFKIWYKKIGVKKQKLLCKKKQKFWCKKNKKFGVKKQKFWCKKTKILV